MLRAMILREMIRLSRPGRLLLYTLFPASASLWLVMRGRGGTAGVFSASILLSVASAAAALSTLEEDRRNDILRTSLPERGSIPLLLIKSLFSLGSPLFFLASAAVASLFIPVGPAAAPLLMTTCLVWPWAAAVAAACLYLLLGRTPAAMLLVATLAAVGVHPILRHPSWTSAYGLKPSLAAGAALSLLLITLAGRYPDRGRVTGETRLKPFPKGG
jgi:hypothetical protein